MMSVAGTRTSAEHGADSDKEPEVVPTSAVVAAVDSVVVVEEADEERRDGQEAVDEAFVPDCLVRVFRTSNYGSVEIPKHDQYSQDQNDAYNQRSLHTQTEVLVHRSP